jgi:hypothetical protein
MTNAHRGIAGDDTPEQMARKAAKAEEASQQGRRPQSKEHERYGTT